MREPHISNHLPPLPLGTPPLWAGVVLAPAAWAAQMGAVYALAGPACERQSRVILHVVTIICFLLAVASGIICWFYRNPASDDHAQDKRIGFLANYGVWASVYFALVIIAQAITTIMLDPCMT